VLPKAHPSTQLDQLDQLLTSKQLERGEPVWHNNGTENGSNLLLEISTQQNQQNKHSVFKPGLLEKS